MFNEFLAMLSLVFALGFFLAADAFHEQGKTFRFFVMCLFSGACLGAAVPLFFG